MSRAAPLRLRQVASWAAALPASFPKEDSLDREGLLLVRSLLSSLIRPPASEVPREAIMACRRLPFKAHAPLDCTKIWLTDPKAEIPTIIIFLLSKFQKHY
jgi:hypothetical protein